MHFPNETNFESSVNIIDVNLKQLRKQLSPIFLTFFGIIIGSIGVSKNALSSIKHSCEFLENSIFERFDLEKAFLPITLTESGTTISLIFEQANRNHSNDSNLEFDSKII